MAQQPTSSVGIDNPWYPEGGPGRHLKTRLKRGDVLIGPMLQQFARPPLIKLFQHAGYDFVYIEYEHTSFDPEDLADTVQSARDNGLPVIAKTPQLERRRSQSCWRPALSAFSCPGPRPAIRSRPC